jgi:hypothetical protein
LDAFAVGETLPSSHLSVIDDGMGPHMQERLVAKTARAFEQRVRLWLDGLTRDLAAPPARTIGGLAATLVDARSRLRPILALTQSALLPSALCDELRAALGRDLDAVQKSLEKSVTPGSPNADQILAAIRANRLDAPLAAATHQSAERSPGGRSVIL